MIENTYSNLEKIGENDKGTFYLDKSLTDWCRKESLEVQKEYWHVLKFYNPKGEFESTLIMDSDTNEIISELKGINSIEVLGTKIDFLKLARRMK